MNHKDDLGGHQVTIRQESFFSRTLIVFSEISTHIFSETHGSFRTECGPVNGSKTAKKDRNLITERRKSEGTGVPVPSSISIDDGKMDTDLTS